ncbi:nitric oxide synthase oxygenase [Wenjunlia tyrosinilytica]|uniref:Nitric oxide synthase oxygenase n=1 Tax=Wenjunlia tyrosinilytica TaxID=1544741 RepID=A0A918DZT0_9ACTN|nr:nitric oxide synthase oxygenase [Wenjunlia tyrosinilytica]GGO91030.1 nitric oxide synthase oxygenase [Wenjunlia tyrosinilytica]
MFNFIRKSGKEECPVRVDEPSPGVPDPEEKGGIRELAEEFLRLHRHEDPHAAPLQPRLREVERQIERSGTYEHTPDELAFGARVAWRNSNRCIGRLYWRSLQVRDRRHIDTAEGMAQEAAGHLRAATNGGRIRPVITVFAQEAPDRPAPRIWSEQLIRYAGYEEDPGPVVGDPRNTGITDAARELGWPGGPGTPFDVLPLIVQGSGEQPRWFELPDDCVLEVPLTHPDLDWFEELGLRWHAVPAISSMCLEIGGVCYPAAPFNGWYMGTEIGARNLADTDRYNLLPTVADGLGLDRSGDRSLWKDRALVELNLAVLHSFDRAGVTVADHHTESRRFLTHLEREERAGRRVGADWSWIVPPLSGAATPVFHRYYDTCEQRPAFAHHPESLVLSRGESLVGHEI